MKKGIFIVLGVLIVACEGFNTVKAVFHTQSPYEKYVESLRKAGLLRTAMGRDWIAAGQRVFTDSILVHAPFTESGYFPSSTTEARSYRFTAREGQVLTVESSVKSKGDARLFLDLFLKEGNNWDRFDIPDSASTFTHEFTSNEECLLRLQPELLANVYYTVAISMTPALPNPVYGASNRSIGSFYGDPRDKGKRLHKGVDIFAIKGTPVLAPTDGEITRVELTPLGGKVVWLRDDKRHQSYYFAHLDSQMVKRGMHVFQGYVVGLVGKTGNARNTAPHLHFGIYTDESKNPLYYILQAKIARCDSVADTTFHRHPFKVKRKQIPLMTGASRRLPLRTLLQKDTYLTAIAESDQWFRVALPDNTEGYVLKKDVIPLSNGMELTLDSPGTLLSEIDEAAIPVANLGEDTSVEILAHFKNYQFVRTELGKAGWILN
jgi:murein DD-endopeptidase MepM/ murein hydrolase activator NlpD